MKLLLLILLSLISLISANYLVLCDDGNGECMREDQCLTDYNPRYFGPNTCTFPQICCYKFHDCGTRNMQIIVNKTHIQKAEFGEFPWQVAVLKNHYHGSPKYIGGGSLIHYKFVLTLATKFANEVPADLIARFGEFDFTSDLEAYPHDEYNIKKIIIHENFKHKGARPNNIALLQLEKPVVLNFHVNIICLPPPYAKFDNKLCLATSWGKNRFSEPDEEYPSILKKSEMLVHDKATCDKAYKDMSANFNGLIPGIICAGGGVKDTCEGHGGSPLGCYGNDGAFYQIGIAAWGFGCKKSEAPIAYTEVSHYVDWIHRKIYD